MPSIMQCNASTMNKALFTIQNSVPINPKFPLILTLILTLILLQKKRDPFIVLSHLLGVQPSPLNSYKRHERDANDETGQCQGGIDGDRVLLEGSVG